MEDFWNNILRYPRFFVTSIAGLAFIILAPFRNLFKIKKLRFILFISSIVFFGVLSKILESMVGL